MRFNDRIETALAQPETGAFALAVKWRQLIDLLARQPDGIDSPEGQAALQFLRERKGEVPAPVRREIAEALSDKANPVLAELLSEDAAPPASTSLNPAAVESEAHIRDLLARLEELQRKGTRMSGTARTKAESFRWEADRSGLLLWVEGTPRGPLIGQSIASPAAPGAFGVDGHAAGAFAKRSPFRDARFSVAGDGPAGGDWRISGVAFFDPALGHFLGYRGSARRPRADEVAQPGSGTAIFGSRLEPDSLRQLIHELRTPLNAILGFAEMIDGQILGPAAEGYRTRAVNIREEATRLLAAVDDLDTAARIETSRFAPEESSTDAVALIHRLHSLYCRLAEQRSATLSLALAPDLPLANVEPASAERMFARLLAAALGLAGEGEDLAARLDRKRLAGGEMLCLSVSRPRSIAGVAEEDLLDPGYTPEGDWPDAPALGLGFALRLVRNLAETVGGKLVIAAVSFELYLPAVGLAGQAGGGEI